MQQSDIHPGLEYALREPPSTDSPVERVRIVEKVRAGKWKVEWLDPNPGLVDYVKSQNVVCLWKDRKALLRDEQNERRLERVVGESWPGEDSPVTGAIDTVLESTSERECWLHKGVLTFRTEALQRITDRADIGMPEHHSGYRDRRGWNHLPFQCALQVARAFAAAEPRTVLTVVELDERQLETQARQPGYSYLLQLLNDRRATWALLRQWAGHDEALAVRDRRIDELTKLLRELTWELRRDTVDPVRIAARIERTLAGR